MVAWSVSVDNDPSTATTGTITINYSGTTGDSLLGVEIYVDNVKISDTANGSFEATVGVSYSIVIARTGNNVEVNVTFSEADLSDGEATLALTAAGGQTIS